MKCSAFIFLVIITLFGYKNDESIKKSIKKTKPNIVFIITDDQTYTSIHALGNKEIVTPNLDELVAQGTSFTNAYNMGS